MSKGNNNNNSSSTNSSSSDDPEKLLNEWLGELKTIIGDLDTKIAPGSPNKQATAAVVQTRNRKNRSSEFNRFSMANLEDSQETELDAILGELSMLEMEKTLTKKVAAPQNIPISPSPLNPPQQVVEQPQNNNLHQLPMEAPSISVANLTHHRSNSIVSSSATSTISSLSTDIQGYAESNGGSSGVGGTREPRTESPDNDSAFSDTVSLLSTDTSSTSSGLTNGQFNSNGTKTGSHLCRGLNLQEFDNQKAAKIHLALQKLEQASVRRLFVKAFTADGASKSLLVDETMSCGHVTRLLSDKNHVRMDPRWALVEQLPEIQMERLYEDHELLVDKLMMWDRDSKNRILFVERTEKVMLFMRPELFLPEHGINVAPKDMDECNRTFMLEDFFNTNSQIPIEGGLYLRADSKKGWKRHHFVLRGSGLYYYPKEKTRSPRDLVCLGLFNDCEVYKGFGWKKKYKAPTDFTFILHASNELANSKTTKPLKILCADDESTLERWILAIRIAKYGKQLWQSYKALKEDLARDDFDEMATRRSSSINSFTGTNLDAVGGGGVPLGIMGSGLNGRPLSRASSSSSSGCLSDENNGFDSEFTTGTIKRKPSMKPNLPLTSMTRQLKEVGENRETPIGSPERGGTLTRAGTAGRIGQPQSQPNHMRQRSIDSSGSGGSGCSTLKRRPLTAEKKEMIVNNHSPLEEKMKHPSVGTITSPLKSMPSCMTDSLFSLPPPPEEEIIIPVDLGSTMSLDTLPPPPSVNELEESLLDSSFSSDICSSLQEEIYTSAASINRSILPMNGNSINPSVVLAASGAAPLIYAQPKKELESCLKKESIYASKAEIKGVLKAESSPVTMRKKVCFEDQVIGAAVTSPSKRLTTSSTTSSSLYGSLPPKPPPRSEATRLSSQPVCAASNNNEFLKDLQRVMRKKWQVSQKCKLDPETNPHEVLGFRDYDEWQKQNQLPYYRQTANVSNWVQEHYGPDSLYENLGVDMATAAPLPPPAQNGGVGQQTVQVGAPIPVNKKRPPPLPPKRSDKTQLTTTPQSQSPVHQINGQSS